MVPTAGDILFVDTNVLLTATDESRPQHQDAGRLLCESGHRGLHLAASGQILLPTVICLPTSRLYSPPPRATSSS